jgi:hyperosmotically inducible protein
MKTSLPKLISLLALGGALTAFTGCAGTPTKESTGEDIDDSAITAKVKAAFINDDMIKSSDISVTTFKGKVQLSGFVDNSDQKSEAVHDAKNVPGVQDVINNLSVK